MTITQRVLVIVAVMTPLTLPAASAWACRGGGQPAEAAFEPPQDRVELLLEAAAEAEQEAATEEGRAQRFRMSARKQRELASSLRERARLFPDVDGSVLFAKAVVADREAVVADSRARTHAGRARNLHTRARELRESARQLVQGDRPMHRRRAAI